MSWGRGKYEYYVCPNRVLGKANLINGKKRCITGPLVRRQYIDEFFWNEVLQSYSNPGYLVRCIKDQKWQKSQIKELEMRKNKLGKDIKQI